MDLSKTQFRAEPVYRKLHRAFFAVCILLAPLVLSLWFGLCPTSAFDAACPDQGSSLAVFSAFRAMNPQLMQLFLFLSLIIPILYPLSYIGLGLLAMKRSPWLATLGIACGFAAGVVWAAIADSMVMLNTMAQTGLNPLFVTVEHHYYSTWLILTFGAFWVIGHLLGYVLLGIALARARVIPLWTACLMIVSALLMGPIAYGASLGLLQILGYVLIFIASVPAALAMLCGEQGGGKPGPYY
ncbi:MAG TPA: hypothetical protein VJ761_20365, partial [Ktedonobacteraceae bacterium]|nr:hypothetical protein [Ktedonobacteraceae bacterium]